LVDQVLVSMYPTNLGLRLNPMCIHNTKLFVFEPAQCATKYKKSFVPAVFSTKGFVAAVAGYKTLAG
jgi:hypothetical protein